MKRTLLIALGCSLATSSLMAQKPSDLKPLLVIPDKVVLAEDFSKPKPLQKGIWQTRQGTRWAIEDGVLRE